MVLEGMFDQAAILQAGLQAANVRNEVYLYNIANVDTPGYKQKAVSFESYLKDALSNRSRSNPVDLRGVQPVIYTQYANYSQRLDGNNIDVEAQMTELYKNALRYDAMASGVMSNFKRINLAISK